MAARDTRLAGSRSLASISAATQATRDAGPATQSGLPGTVLPLHPGLTPPTDRTASGQSSGSLSHQLPRLILDTVSFLLAALALPPQVDLAWACLALLGVHAGLRALIPERQPSTDGNSTDSPRTPEPLVGLNRHSLSWGVDSGLWMALMLALAGLDGMSAIALAMALAVSFVAAASGVRQHAFPPLLAASWTLPIITFAVGVSHGMGFGIALCLWALAVVTVSGLLGRKAPLPVTIAPLQTAPVVSQGSTRRGVQLAVRTSLSPMVALHNGFVFELNRSAASLLGGNVDVLRGKRLDDFADIEPTDFSKRLFERKPLPKSLVLQPYGRQAQRVRAHINHGQSSSGESLLVMALEAISDLPSTPAANLTPPATGGVAPEPVTVIPFFADSSLPSSRVTAALAARLPPPPAPITAQSSTSAPTSVSTPAQSPALTQSSAHPLPEPPPVIAKAAQALLPNVLGNLPVLTWVVDQDGRIRYAHETDLRRWGMRIEPQKKPRWWDAFTFRNRSRETFLGAVRAAFAGRPSYDIFVERASHSGGRLALRSHVVPIEWPDAGGNKVRCALVLDTIASVRELLEYERIRQRKEHYKSLVESSPNFVWSCDANYRFTYVSRRACADLYGYQVDDLIGASVAVLLNRATDQSTMRTALVGLRTGASFRDVAAVHVTKGGQRLNVTMSATPTLDTQGNFKGAMGIVIDATMLKDREASLADALHLERTILDAAGQALAVVRNHQVIRCNDAFVGLLQRPLDQIQSTRVVEFFADQDDWREATVEADRAAAADRPVVREVRLWRLEPGATEPLSLWCQMTIRTVGPGEYVLVLADIDAIRRREAHALFDAQHDALTGLANRRLLSERAMQAMVRLANTDTRCAVVLIDLDRFKIINDNYGHLTGDEVLQEIAHRLQRVVRPPDTVARYGGDEFAIFLPNIGSRRDIEAVARRLIDECARPVHISGRMEKILSASVGVAVAGSGALDPTALLSLADRAMYDAKMQGGNRAVFAPHADWSVSEVAAISGADTQSGDVGPDRRRRPDLTEAESDEPSPKVA